jgi:hypothetical protein
MAGDDKLWYFMMIEAEELLAKVSNVKTVQAMRKELTERAHQQQFNDIMEYGMFDDFMD